MNLSHLSTNRWTASWDSITRTWPSSRTLSCLLILTLKITRILTLLSSKVKSTPRESTKCAKASNDQQTPATKTASVWKMTVSNVQIWYAECNAKTTPAETHKSDKRKTFYAGLKTKPKTKYTTPTIIYTTKSSTDSNCMNFIHLASTCIRQTYCTNWCRSEGYKTV